MNIKERKGVKKMGEKKREIRLAELRALDLENDNQLVQGYALVFDQPTVLYEYGGVEYKEVIARGALDEADLTDVPFKYNHSDNVMIMARTRNKTLQLTIDDTGLLINADLAKTTSGKDMYELIRRGDIDKMSFAFRVKEDSYDRETNTRTILKISKLYDVAAVDMPAYDQTSISARSYFEERTLENSKEIVLLRKKILVKTYL